MPNYGYDKDYPFAAFITNLGKYNEGELVGEWVKFPTTAEEMKKVFDRIGIGQKDDFGQPYEEWFITDYDCYVDGLYDKLGEYESLDELNYLASKLDEMSQGEYEQFQAAMEIGDHSGSLQEIINLTENLDCYDVYPDIRDHDDLGRYYIEELDAMQVPEHLRNYIDYEAYGRDIALEEGGEFTDIRQAASPVGTTFVVEDLFYNTPVRRKFLKKPAIEAGLVSDYMLRLILSHPEIAFRFVSQGKTIYHSMGDGKLDSALFCLYGKDAFRQMIPVSGHQSGVVLKGFIGVGELSRGNRQQQSFFINGRFFRSGVLSRALENGCEGRVMIGKFPMCALFLEMPYQNVDVNVHPNKLEVRFQDESAVAEAVRQIVYDALHQEQLGQHDVYHGLLKCFWLLLVEIEKSYQG